MGKLFLRVQNAACRVGSSTRGASRCDPSSPGAGEQVEVLDAVQVSNDNGVEFCCKIAPPSGEFPLDS